MEKLKGTALAHRVFDAGSDEAKIRVIALLGIVLDLAVLALELTRIMPGNAVKNASDVVILALLILLLARPGQTWPLAVIGIGECVINLYYGGHILGFLYYAFGLGILLKNGFFRSHRAIKVPLLAAILVGSALSQLWTFSLKRFSITAVNIVLAGALIFGFLYLFHDALRSFYREKPVLDLGQSGLTPRQLDCVRGCVAGKRVKEMAAELIVSESVVKKELIAVYERLGVSDYRELRFRLANSRLRFPENPAI